MVNRHRPPLRGVCGKEPSHRLHRAVVEIVDRQMADGNIVRNAAERRLVERAERVLNV